MKSKAQAALRLGGLGETTLELIPEKIEILPCMPTTNLSTKSLRTPAQPDRLQSVFFEGYRQAFGFVDGFHFADPEPEESGLSDEAIDSLPDTVNGESITGLKNALKSERAKAAAAEKKLKQFHELGDPDEIARLKKQIADREQMENQVRAQASSAIAEEKAKYEPQIAASNQRIAELESNYQALAKRVAVERWFTRKEVAGLPSEFDNFYLLTQHRFVFDPETKKIKEVLDRNGNPIFVEGKVADPAELMLQFRKGEESYALSACFEPFNRASGGGMPSNSSGGNRGDSWKGLSTTDKFMAGFDRTQRRQ